ncbi:hypothetical protein [Clostridium sp. FP1]|uniref:hypothetical protein n=1 Tax=Clostridium sp. FP1 TaxID=2724076 RepID=UPI0013E97635|nr:hypothetical protein [Clostridium sp. FP1]MBZ9634682.1 hypothetical protein [Clostridium sp. FP1]
MPNEFERIIQKASDVMENPKLLYRYEDIILGVPVRISNGKYENMWAVSPSTWRAFREIDSPSEIYKGIMIKNKNIVIASLNNAKSVEDINIIENKLYDIILKELKNANRNQYSSILDSYNRIRKPIDLYIEHIVLMSKELDKERKDIIPLLYLPLDSWIFNSNLIFSLEELYGVGLDRSSQYGMLNNETDYIKLQEILSKRVSFIAKQINEKFSRIFLDLFWSDRYKRSGTNLFETNK